MVNLLVILCQTHFVLLHTQTRLLVSRQSPECSEFSLTGLEYFFLVHEIRGGFRGGAGSGRLPSWGFDPLLTQRNPPLYYFECFGLFSALGELGKSIRSIGLQKKGRQNF